MIPTHDEIQEQMRLAVEAVTEKDPPDLEEGELRIRLAWEHYGALDSYHKKIKADLNNHTTEVLNRLDHPVPVGADSELRLKVDSKLVPRDQYEYLMHVFRSKGIETVLAFISSGSIKISEVMRGFPESIGTHFYNKGSGEMRPMKMKKGQRAVPVKTGGDS